MKELITILLFLCLAAGLAYHLFSLFCTLKFLEKKQKRASSPEQPPVSILKPLKGIDPEFEKNLKTFCEQDYSSYEVLLGFSEDTDEMALNNHLASTGDCNIRSVRTGDDLGVNKKVSNLQGLVDASRFPLLAISDSDMRVDRFYLRNIVEEYNSEENIGLVTCLYKISEPQTPGSALESLTIALDFIPSVFTARRLEGVRFGLGASMLVSKKAIEEIGGFSAIRDFMADDYQIGYRLWKKGYKILLSRVVIENVVGPMTIADYFTHQIRWARTYRASRPKGFAGYGITHIVPITLLLLSVHGFTPLTMSLLGFVFSLRFATAALLYQKVIQKREWLKWLPLIPLKDLLSFAIWAWSFASRRVSWRGREFNILKDGRIVEKNATAEFADQCPRKTF